MTRPNQPQAFAATHAQLRDASTTENPTKKNIGDEHAPRQGDGKKHVKQLFGTLFVRCPPSSQSKRGAQAGSVWQGGFRREAAGRSPDGVTAEVL